MDARLCLSCGVRVIYTCSSITRTAMRLLSFSALLLTIATASARPSVKVVVPQFDFPKGSYMDTAASGVSNNGAVVGSVRDASGVTMLFERLPGGGYSAPVGFPDASSTYPRGVNNSNLICGWYSKGLLVHGFFYDPATGTFSPYDVPGEVNTRLSGINDAGDTCGWTDSSAFVNRGGSLVAFAIPDADYTAPEAINNLGQVVGCYRPTGTNQVHSFFRDADGTLTYPLDYPDAIFTQINGLNDNGLMSGNYNLHDDAVAHGFVRQLSGRSITFDVGDGLYGTNVHGINNSGLMPGIYLSVSDSLLHSFLARFVP